jgi:hypothetical protein
MQKLMKHISNCFYKPDLQAARIILGTAFAHYIDKQPPIWMFVVGPPSSGKTAITIEALSGLTAMFGPGQPWGMGSGEAPAGSDDMDSLMAGVARNKSRNTNPRYRSNESVEIMSTINANSFLSHQIGKDGEGHAPGLLEQLSGGKYTMEKQGTRKHVKGNALVLIPDFTVMASMNRDKRGEIMGQLRRIYDGQFEKKVGTKITKIWNGKLSLLAATTPVIDKYTSIDSALGERFIQMNWRASQDIDRGTFTLKMMRLRAEGLDIKKPMKEFVKRLFGEHDPTLMQVDDDHPVNGRLSALAELIAESRTSVYGQVFDEKFNVTETACPEDIHRIIQQFYIQMSGVCTLQSRLQPIEQDIQDILRVGIETLPTYRSVVLQAAIECKSLREYAGKDLEKRHEATKLAALGVIEPVKGEAIILRKRWADVVKRVGFANHIVFERDGAAGSRERTERQTQADTAAGLDTVF